MSGLLSSLLPGADAILGVRDSIGAVKQPVYFVTRTWFQDANFMTESTDISGHAKDSVSQMLPSPQIVELNKDLNAREAGVVESGDVLLKNVSLNKYKESQLDGSSPKNNVESLYKIGAKMYQVVKVTQVYVTWNIVLKRMTNQTTY